MGLFAFVDRKLQPFIQGKIQRYSVPLMPATEKYFYQEMPSRTLTRLFGL
jgi:hypothetical protein